MLAVTGCAGSIVVRADATPCTALVPGGLRDDVPDQPEPPAGVSDPLAALKDWIGFGVQERADKRAEQTRKTAIVELIDRCEARDRAALKAARPKFLGII